ncbi:hypothetical protein M2140_001947 [Clostridiales Family XIII bacterium PM5-7]
MSIKIKQINGLMSDGKSIWKADVTVRFTSEKIGETLSLESNGVMITVGFEDIEKVIKKGRK